MLKWGSLEKVELEKEVRETDTDEAHFPIYKRYLLEKYREVGNLAQLVVKLKVSLFRGNDGKMRSSVVRTGQSDNSGGDRILNLPTLSIVLRVTSC